MMAGKLNVDAIVFDFDGTLAPTNIDFAEMRRRILQHLRTWGLYQPGVEDGKYVLEIIAWGREQLSDQPANLARYCREAADILRQVELPCCQQAQPFAGVSETLDQLRAAGIKIGIITRNSRAGVGAVLDRHPLPYDVLLTRDDLAEVKPHPEHLQQALELLGVPSSRALMVGDHASDIQCGQAAGVLTCGVLTSKTTLEEFHRLGADMAFSDVPSLVAFILEHRP